MLNKNSYMLYFTKYAEQKFDILNKYKVFITKEQVENVITNAEKVKKKKYYWTAGKEGTAVLYKKEGDLIKIITFYPTKV
ncbi:MAG: hypothetical protein NTW06_04160 [Candidatus Falkowbacteria bacterium]|nr:hypothetical protein [Candidatus Falkowbacteria bacterium]